MIYDPSVRDNSIYLKLALEKVDQTVDKSVRYLMLTDRFKDVLYVFKIKNIDGINIEELELTEE